VTAKQWLRSFTSGLLAAALILLSTLFLAQQVVESTFFRRSRFVSAVLSQDSTSLTGILSDPQKLDASAKFLGAVTTAYINFEMIPVNEARTFTVIFESLPGDIAVDSFTYQGKTLLIAGEAPDEKILEDFRQDLTEQAYFTAVSLHQYTTVEDRIRFEMACGL
jgi:Tfp pilus assembly protein PilN